MEVNQKSNSPKKRFACVLTSTVPAANRERISRLNEWPKRNERGGRRRPRFAGPSWKVWRSECTSRNIIGRAEVGVIDVVGWRPSGRVSGLAFVC
jgi:hypothetical protein